MKKIKLFFSSIISLVASVLFAVGVNAQSINPATNDKFNPVILIVAGIALVGIVIIIVLSVKKGKNNSSDNNKNDNSVNDDTDNSEGL